MNRNLAQIIRIMLILLSFATFAAAQKAVVPIVSLTTEENDNGAGINYGNLLGCVENGKWLDAKTTAKKLKSGQKFSLFDFKSGVKSEFLLGEFKDGADACPENYYVEPQIKASADFAVGTNAGWAIIPRKAKTLGLTDANAKKAVADVLRLQGLPKSAVRIKQAVRVDLDGDGADEVVIAATQVVMDKNEVAKIGSYSLIIVQKTVGGKKQNLMIAGSFLKKKSDYYEGEHFISGIADLNGDGKMEILVDVSGYEENWTKVFEMKAGKPSEIKALSYYCGV